MSSDSKAAEDVKALFRRFGGSTESYQEVIRDQAAAASRSRWPLLEKIDVSRATSAPPVNSAGLRPVRGAVPAPMAGGAADKPTAVRASPSTAATEPAAAIPEAVARVANVQPRVAAQAPSPTVGMASSAPVISKVVSASAAASSLFERKSAAQPTTSTPAEAVSTAKQPDAPVKKSLVGLFGRLSGSTPGASGKPSAMAMFGKKSK